MGARRKVLFAIWSVIYLVIPITEFAYGVYATENNTPCASVSLVAPCLIGVGVTEAILLACIVAIVYLRYTDSGNTVHVTTTTTTYSDGSTKVERSSWTARNLTYGFTFLTVLIIACFFFALHQVFTVNSTVQFTYSSSSTYCDRQLYQAAFGLLIASYIVGLLLAIFGRIIYKMKT